MTRGWRLSALLTPTEKDATRSRNEEAEQDASHSLILRVAGFHNDYNL